MRLDVFLTENGFSCSRTRAKNLIELGSVTVNGKIADKPSAEVNAEDEVKILSDYDASLGGIKLRGAIEKTKVSVSGCCCLDIGSSNGGFCDVLLSFGAKKVIACDVAECALPDRLKTDARILIKDNTNARFLMPEDLPYQPDFITVDVSFISLSFILPTVYRCLKQGGKALTLVKPQFECGKQALSKKGVILHKKDEERAVASMRKTAEELGFTVLDSFPAPHPFANKNQEYFLFLCK